jgi:hypothetical protein
VLRCKQDPAKVEDETLKLVVYIKPVQNLLPDLSPDLFQNSKGKPETQRNQSPKGK